MTDRAPIEVANLDRYGSTEIPWSRPCDLRTGSSPTPDIAFFLGTVRPDGRLHAAGIGALWLDGDLYFTSGPDKGSENYSRGTFSADGTTGGYTYTLERSHADR